MTGVISVEARKPCSHATAETTVCKRCDHKRALMLAWRKQNEDRGHQDYGVVRLSWAVPQIGGRHV